jgi:hypothetical protein
VNIRKETKLICTEKEAKTKWCTFAQELFIRGENGVGHCNINFKERIKCIASECMAWCWYGDYGSKAPISGYCGRNVDV